METTVSIKFVYRFVYRKDATIMDETLTLIEEFLHEEHDTLPPGVPKSHKMLMHAIRHVSIEAKDERAALQGQITEISVLLLGKKPDQSNGVIEQIKTNTRFRKIFTWFLVIVATAFLGGFGTWVWGLVQP